MSNEEIFKQLSEIYSEEALIGFCHKVSTMYDILYKSELENNRWEPLEFNYDAKWWRDKYYELLNTYSHV